ncbi:MAG: hypothetical protein U9O59_05455 [Actinomycetota bacterium]|nr:hypothetical protein [Actinomycetota bacterium]
MMDKELSGKISKKLKDINSLKALNSKDLKFKTWHVSTMNLLKMLPPDFINELNDFKKLTFSDTKYHRGTKPFNPLDNTKYREDLDSAGKILKKIIPAKKESKENRSSGAKKDTSLKKRKQKN